jgi:predicted RNA-binding Zn-ribbon protein involved in translation (DUF1610 family)
MRVSNLTERQERNQLCWLVECPKCGPYNIMEIRAVFPLFTVPGSSIIAYHCEDCGFTDEVLID